MTRRSKPEGHVRQRESGSWVAILPLPKDPTTGARKSRWITCKTEKEAWKALRKALSERDAGVLVSPGKVTLSQHFEEWIETVGRHTWSAYTLQETTRLAGRIVKELGHLPLSELTPLKIQKYYSDLLDTGLLTSTVSHYHALLKQCLNYAVDMDRLARNPCARARLPRQEKREAAILDAAQTARLVAAARGQRSFIAILLAVTTGMRRGEILALRWEDVDFERGTARISRSLERTKAEGRQYKAPKSKSGNRTVSLPKTTVAALLKHRAAQAEYRLQMGPAYADEGLIVAAAFGSPLPEAIIQREFTALKATLGLPAVTFHSLRHTHASLLLARGMPLPAVSRRLGHRDAGITARVYSHALEESEVQAAVIVDEVLRAG